MLREQTGDEFTGTCGVRTITTTRQRKGERERTESNRCDSTWPLGLIIYLVTFSNWTYSIHLPTLHIIIFCALFRVALALFLCIGLCTNGLRWLGIFCRCDEVSSSHPCAWSWSRPTANKITEHICPHSRSFWSQPLLSLYLICLLCSFDCPYLLHYYYCYYFPTICIFCTKQQHIFVWFVLFSYIY